MRPSDHLLVLWQWDTAVRLQRMAGRAAVERPVADWLALQRAADLTALEATRSMLNYTGAAIVRPADVARGN